MATFTQNPMQAVPAPAPAAQTATSMPQIIAQAIGRGKKRKEIMDILVKAGMNAPEAESLVAYSLANHKADIRKGAVKQIGVGALMLVIGIVVTAATYSMARNGGMYIVAWGPAIFGALGVIRGLFRLIFA